jgi:hypothetical protein
MTYSELDSILGPRFSKKIDNNTFAARAPLGGSILITLHHNAVLEFFPDGACRYSSCGWRTPTTKDRLNRFGLPGVRVYQRSGQWRIERNGKSEPFTDGVIIYP